MNGVNYELLEIIGQRSDGFYCEKGGKHWADCLSLKRAGCLKVSYHYDGEFNGDESRGVIIGGTFRLIRTYEETLLNRLKVSAGGVIIQTGGDEWNTAAILERQGRVHIETRPDGKSARVTIADEVIYNEPPQPLPGAIMVKEFPRTWDELVSGAWMSSDNLKPLIVPVNSQPASRDDIIKAVRELCAANHGKYILHALLAGFMIDVIGDMRLTSGLDRSDALDGLITMLENIYPQFGEPNGDW